MNFSYPTSYPASLFGILLLPPFMKPACQFRFVFVFPVGHLVSRWCHNILTLLKDTTPLRYYQGSDSSTSHQRQRSPWFSRLTFLMFRPQPRYAPDPRFIHHRNGISEFQTSPRMSKLVADMPRIGFVILRTTISPPVAPHPASWRRSYLRLHGWFTMARTSTVLIKRLPRRTHSWLDQESRGIRNQETLSVIGVRKALASLPSEPCVRFSRTRLSSRWFPHRDWLATHRASFPACQFRFVFVFPVSHLVSRWCHNILTLLTDTTMVKSPSCAKKRSPLTPLPRAANIRSIHIVVSTHLQ